MEIPTHYYIGMRTRTICYVFACGDCQDNIGYEHRA